MAGFQHPGHARSSRFHQIESSRWNLAVLDGSDPKIEALNPKNEVSGSKNKTFSTIGWGYNLLIPRDEGSTHLGLEVLGLLTSDHA